MKKLLHYKKLAEVIDRPASSVYRWLYKKQAVPHDIIGRLVDETGVRAEAWALPWKYPNPYYEKRGK